MRLLPSLLGALQRRLTNLLPTLPVTVRGVLGRPLGTILLDGADDSLSPTSLVATTVKV